MWKQTGFLYHPGHPAVRGEILNGDGKIQGYPEMLPDLTDRDHECGIHYPGGIEFCGWASVSVSYDWKMGRFRR